MILHSSRCGISRAFGLMLVCVFPLLSPVMARQAPPVSLRLLVVASEAQAVELRARIEGGEPFADFARQYSLDPSAATGGYLNSVVPGDLRREFQNALEGLMPGEMSPVVPVAGRFALIQLLPGPLPTAVDLVQAAADADVGRLSELLAAGVDADAVPGGGITALMVAAQRGHTEVVGALLAAGADPNAQALNGSTPLIEAVVGGHSAIAEALLSAGADANVPFVDGSTALMGAAEAGDVEMMRALLEAGADPNLKAADGSTALFAASFSGVIEGVRVLLDAGADLNAVLADESTVLMQAAGAGHAEIVRLLTDRGADANARAANGATALTEAAYGGHTPVVGTLLTAAADPNARLNDGSTALMAAALGGQASVVGLLLEAGADARVRSRDGTTALMEAAHSGHDEIVTMLLTAGAEVNAALDDGTTALMGAALGGYTGIVEALLAAGADPDAEDAKGWTALRHAAASATPSTVLALIDVTEVDAQERRIVRGSTYVNEYYATEDPELLALAAAELRVALDTEPDNLEALEWLAGVEFLGWGERPNFDQYGRVHALLERNVALDPDDADRHYWLAAANAIFAAQGTGAAEADYAAMLDEGIEHATRAMEIDPLYADAVAFLAHLYRGKAIRMPNAEERDQLLELAEATWQESLRIAAIRGARLSRPDDQFSRPAPPPPPLWTAPGDN